jgi:hypothetical protein
MSANEAPVGRFDDDAARMTRSHHRAALTEAIARFQADLRRLARTVLRDELARILATLDPTFTPKDAGTHARTATATRKQSTARRRTGAQRAAARHGKPAAAAGTRVERVSAELGLTRFRGHRNYAAFTCCMN